MKTAICKLKSITPLSFSKYVSVGRLPKELDKDYEERTWKEKAHYDENGIFIPGTMFKHAIEEVATYLSEKIPGKGNGTYSKHFKAGLMNIDNSYLGIKLDDVKRETYFVPSDGVRNGSKRVHKSFPVIPKWEAVTTFHIIDSTITKEIFEKYLKEAGSLVGIGRFRPRNGGFYGRFSVESIEWSE